MKGISCFRPKLSSPELDDEAPRMPRKKAFKRQGSNQSQASRCSTASNSSISKLPPCKRQSDAEIEAMMMPVPPEHDRESRCLRMSRPGIYGDIVHAMKQTKGCRNWRSFDVFYKDEVDMAVSADDVARKRARQYEMNVRALNSFPSTSDECRRSIDDVDLIG